MVENGWNVEDVTVYRHRLEWVTHVPTPAARPKFTVTAPPGFFPPGTVTFTPNIPAGAAPAVQGGEPQ